MKESICIFGDSTAWGAFDMEKGGWANRLWFHVIEKQSDDYYIEIYNCSISGGTTETILKRFESEANIRNCKALIFQTGGNDASYEGDPGNYKVSPDQFRVNLEQIIEKAKEITPDIVFLDLKNCIEKLTTPVF